MAAEKTPQLPTRSQHHAIFNSSYLDDIPSALSQWGSQKVLLVFSKSMDNNTSIIKDLSQRLGSKVVAKKSGVGSHSPYPDVIDIARLIHEHNVDCLICIGSSSYSDACKIACLLHSTLSPGFNEEDMESLVDQNKGVSLRENIAPRKIRLILVPTSLSASEWNDISSCTNFERKKQHFGPDREGGGAADLILLDPKVAATSPEKLWLSSGFRAVDHCVETICNRHLPEHRDKDEILAWAKEGLQTLLLGLRDYRDGKTKHDEDELMRGIDSCQKGARLAMMGLVIHHISMGPSHAIGHQIGSVAGVMHGVTSCIMLAPVLRYQKKKGISVNAQNTVLEIFNSTLNWHEKEAADAVQRFVEYLKLPNKLSDVGVGKDVEGDKMVDKIAEKSMTDILADFESKDEILEILGMAR